MDSEPIARLRALTIKRKELVQHRDDIYQDCDKLDAARRELKAQHDRLTDKISVITNNIHGIDNEVKAILAAHFGAKEKKDE
jgi:Trp operon repressor